MSKALLISGENDIVIKHNEVKKCRLKMGLRYLTLLKLVGLNNVAPKSATVYVGEEPVSHYNTPSGVLYPNSEEQTPFHIPDQLVNIRLELDTSEFTPGQLLKIEMVLSVIGLP